jgi:hypothetical protein
MINSLKYITGKDYSSLFTGWVYPGTPDPFIKEYLSIQESISRAYSSFPVLESNILKWKGYPGIESIVKLYETVKPAMTTELNAPWTMGKYDESDMTLAEQINKLSALYKSWDKADKSYSDAKATIGQIQDDFGTGILKELESARTLLADGQFDNAGVHAEAALTIYKKYKPVFISYSVVVADLSKYKNELGITNYANIEGLLKTAAGSITAGDLSAANLKINDAKRTLNEWLIAYRFFSSIESNIINSEGIGIETVKQNLALAKNSLALGKYTESDTLRQRTSAAFNDWQKAFDAYSNLSTTISSHNGTAMDFVTNELQQVVKALEQGKFADSLALSQIATKDYEEWQSANAVYLEAQAAVEKAKQEGRTSGLKDGEALLLKYEQLAKEGKYEEAITVSVQAKDIADKATPSRIGYVIGGVASVIVIGMITSIILVKKRKSGVTVK